MGDAATWVWVAVISCGAAHCPCYEGHCFRHDRPSLVFFQSEVPCLEFASQLEDLHEGVGGECYFYGKGRSRALLRATTWERVWQELTPPKEEVREQAERPSSGVTGATGTTKDAPSSKKDTALLEDLPPPATEAQASWHKELIARISRYKRYPEAAKAKQLQGLAKVKFTIDRAGRVLLAQVVQSSGSALLDAEAIAMLFRAAPLPLPPPETPGTSFDLFLPIRFAIDDTVAIGN
jgi:TonB family protein